MKIETINGMVLHTGNKDAFTGVVLAGLHNVPIYIATDSQDYERFWINEQSFFTIVNIFNLFNNKPVDIYLTFEDVQNIKVNLGLKPDKRCIDSEMEELFDYPFREVCYDNTEEMASEGNSLYDDAPVADFNPEILWNN